MKWSQRVIRWFTASFEEGLDTTEYVERIERELGIVISDEIAGSIATPWPAESSSS